MYFVFAIRGRLKIGSSNRKSLQIRLVMVNHLKFCPSPRLITATSLIKREWCRVIKNWTEWTKMPLSRTKLTKLPLSHLLPSSLSPSQPPPPTKFTAAAKTHRILPLQQKHNKKFGKIEEPKSCSANSAPLFPNSSTNWRFLAYILLLTPPHNNKHPFRIA